MMKLKYLGFNVRVSERKVSKVFTDHGSSHTIVTSQNFAQPIRYTQINQVECWNDLTLMRLVAQVSIHIEHEVPLIQTYICNFACK